MNRRVVLGTSAAVFSLSGCLSGGDILSTDAAATVESKSIRVLNRRCLENDDAEHTAQIEVEESDNRVQLRGTIATHRECLNLALVSKRGEMENGRTTDDIDVDIEFRIRSDTGGNCEPCPSELDYEATLVFDQLPSSLEIRHVELQDAQNKTVRVGPIAEKSFDS